MNVRACFISRHSKLIRMALFRILRQDIPALLASEYGRHDDGVLHSHDKDGIPSPRSVNNTAEVHPLINIEFRKHCYGTKKNKVNLNDIWIQ